MMIRLGGDGPQDLELQLVQDQDLVDTIKLVAGKDHPDGLVPGTAIDWPTGTTAWFTVRNKGTQSKQRWDLDVEGPWIHIDVDSDLVNLVSREAKVRLWLQYPTTVTDAGPFVWAQGAVVWA